MRPRVFPAEDRLRHRRARQHQRASMRPRVFPAEDLGDVARLRLPAQASMRPRVFPAEDERRAGCPEPVALVASMRPRVFPAEDRPCGAAHGASSGASMRPRVFPAEDTASAGGRVETGGRFNEAAGIPRGRPVRRRHGGSTEARASMRPRVFPAEDVRHHLRLLHQRQASMRPRVFPAEDVAAGRALHVADSSFNEAAGIPRGRPPTRRCFPQR